MPHLLRHFSRRFALNDLVIAGRRPYSFGTLKVRTRTDEASYENRPIAKRASDDGPSRVDGRKPESSYPATDRYPKL